MCVSVCVCVCVRVSNRVSEALSCADYKVGSDMKEEPVQSLSLSLSLSLSRSLYSSCLLTTKNTYRCRVESERRVCEAEKNDCGDV